ncbi:MAG: DUF2336 domain-containing protein [Rhizobiaceae bacterium]|nr:DUF2336 domain-containing protein [Rhizobiaceae bacterium]
MDRFRDLERAGETGRKDAALLATIAGFESLQRPTAYELRQFSTLFIALFELAHVDTKRTAAAALSRFNNLPENVAAIVADQPIAVAAPFLAFCPSLCDQTLLQIISSRGIPHARAIARRTCLSPVMLKVLTDMNDTIVTRSLRVRYDLPDLVQQSGTDATEQLHRRNEDALREQLRQMALGVGQLQPSPPIQNDNIAKPIGAVLVESAEASQPQRFAQLLAEALSATVKLAERIMLDISGRQLVMALHYLEVMEDEALRILIAIFPQLGATPQHRQQAMQLLTTCDRSDSKWRVEAWIRANATFAAKTRPAHQPYSVETPGRIDRSRADQQDGAATRSTARSGQLSNHTIRKA